MIESDKKSFLGVIFGSSDNIPFKLAHQYTIKRISTNTNVNLLLSQSLYWSIKESA
jgi:hypothetical protein